MKQNLLGFIATPAQGQTPDDNVDWCADNGCYSNKWTANKWLDWLQQQPTTMRFAVCPDAVADAHTTNVLFEKWQPVMQQLGVPVAYVAQDQVTTSMVPWDRISTLFIGGTTEWKLSTHSTQLVTEAKQRGLWVHVGRVNSYKRLRWADNIGADSCDGTFLTFGPDINLPKLLRWLDRINTQHTLF
jgi:hypothetical protein